MKKYSAIFAFITKYYMIEITGSYDKKPEVAYGQ
jgi:hypothetical protein